MLLGGLMKALFTRRYYPGSDVKYSAGRTLSKWPATCAFFLPAIDAIKQHCDVMNVDAGVDYRLRTLTQAHLWLSPLDDETRAQIDNLWLALAGAKTEKIHRR